MSKPEEHHFVAAAWGGFWCAVCLLEPFCTFVAHRGSTVGTLACETGD